MSRHGLIPLVNSLDVPGMFARSVSDISEYLRILQGVDPLDSTTVDLSNICNDTKEYDIKKMTIGIPQEYYCEGMSEEIINVWSQVADFLENEGIKVVPVSLPHTKYSITCYQILRRNFMNMNAIIKKEEKIKREKVFYIPVFLSQINRDAL